MQSFSSKAKLIIAQPTLTLEVCGVKRCTHDDYFSHHTNRALANVPLSGVMPCRDMQSISAIRLLSGQNLSQMFDNRLFSLADESPIQMSHARHVADDAGFSAALLDGLQLVVHHRC